MNPVNDTAQNGPKVEEVIQKGASGAILLPVNPSNDAIAAATAIYLGLTKLGKNMTLVCETPVKSDLTGADKVQDELTTAGDNLVISFPYTDGAIDKVDYNIQGSTFNLIVSPRQGQPKLNPDQVKYSYSGGTVDFVITIDAPNLHSLGRSYNENKTQIDGKTIVNIDRHLVNDFFGTVNMVNKTSSSTSELALQFLEDVSAEVDKDIATNLYSGLMGATNNFTSYSVNAQTFECAARLLKAGALKRQIKKPVTGQPQQAMGAQNFNRKPFNGQPAPKAAPAAPTNPPVGFDDEEQIKPIEAVERNPEMKDSDEESSQDWLKPKIFRGTGLI